LVRSLFDALPFRANGAQARRMPSGSSHRLELETLENRCVPATVIRPISDFVDQQGTFVIDDGTGNPFLFVPPVQNFFGCTDPNSGQAMSIDYAGLASDYLATQGINIPTRTSGSVIETELPDGRAEVTVLLHTRNALTWAIPWDPASTANQFGENPLFFGARPLDVVAGAKPALGESFFVFKFINDAPGDTLPDILQLAIAPEPGQELVGLVFTASAEGELRDEFGVRDGTRGRVETVQVGLFQDTPSFPVESVTIEVFGKGHRQHGGPLHVRHEALMLAALNSIYAEEGKPGKKK
jgi:hypothetical protein